MRFSASWKKLFEIALKLWGPSSRCKARIQFQSDLNSAYLWFYRTALNLSKMISLSAWVRWGVSDPVRQSSIADTLTVRTIFKKNSGNGSFASNTSSLSSNYVNRSVPYCYFLPVQQALLLVFYAFAFFHALEWCVVSLAWVSPGQVLALVEPDPTYFCSVSQSFGVAVLHLRIAVEAS